MEIKPFEATAIRTALAAIDTCIATLKTLPCSVKTDYSIGLALHRIAGERLDLARELIGFNDQTPATRQVDRISLPGRTDRSTPESRAHPTHSESHWPGNPCQPGCTGYVDPKSGSQRA